MDHHAYLLLGEAKEVETFLKNIFQDVGLKRVANPDVVEVNYEVFGVDDARALSERAIGKAFGERKAFIIHAEKFTPEAQNALLKTFEDPVPNTHFFITAHEASTFLPTLLSRLHILRLGGVMDDDKAVKKFLEKTPAKRIDFAKAFEGSLPDFLDKLLLTLREAKTPLETMRKVSQVRSYASDAATQPRVILEYLALVL